MAYCDLRKAVESGPESLGNLGWPKPTPFGAVLLSFFVLLFSSGSMPYFDEPSGTETADTKALAVFQKG